jgi:hypothetical protein
MPSVNRLTNYDVLRKAGFNSAAATKLKDFKIDTIRELVRCANELNPDVKERFANILGKQLKISIVFKVD